MCLGAFCSGAQFYILLIRDHKTDGFYVNFAYLRQSGVIPLKCSVVGESRAISDTHAGCWVPQAGVWWQPVGSCYKVCFSKTEGNGTMIGGFLLIDEPLINMTPPPTPYQLIQPEPDSRACTRRLVWKHRELQFVHK